VAYNTLLVPRIRRAGYPRSALLATAALVPVGLLVVRSGAGSLPILLIGGALLLMLSTIVPQIFGRVAAQMDQGAQASAVTRLRLITVGGYIAGLLLYALTAAAGLDPLLTALVMAVLTVAGATRPGFAGRALPRADGASEIDGRVHSGAFATALVLVALLKSADTLRGIYLPLYAVSSGLRAADVPPLFLTSALLEFAALPLLGRLSAARGSAVTLVVIALFGVGSFSLLLLATTYPVLLLAQVLYAVVGVGFQSTGLVLLGRTSRGGVGAGASAYTAVTQVGTVLGAVLPLMVEGYSSGIFVIATVLVALAGMLAVALRAVGGRW
jgi:SET family sugar efflux transporter-like MFS transporter